MTKIFISYRRDDSRKDVGRIYDRLIEVFGKDNVFKDVDSIPMGKDFRGVLRKAVVQCDVLLAVIGTQWLDIQDISGNRRLNNENDFVRIEIESALQRDNCLVIPVLVDEAVMPQADALPASLRELAFKNATVVRDDPDFHSDVQKIISGLQKQFGSEPATILHSSNRLSDMQMRALKVDWKQIKESATVKVVDEDILSVHPPTYFLLEFEMNGITRVDHNDKPVIVKSHIVEFSVHDKYPMSLPSVRFQTPIFHPNIAETGEVCIGWFRFPCLISDLCPHIAQLINYTTYNINSPTNYRAAMWAKNNMHLLPLSDTC